MKGKKGSKWLLIVPLILIVIISVTLYFLFNPLGSKGDVRLNVFEQRWIQNNKNEIINVYLPNDLPLYSSDGKGIIFSFLDYFQNQTELEFNRVPYTMGQDTDIKGNQFRVLKSDAKLGANDLVFYNDNYVVVSLNSEQATSLDSIHGNIGVLEDDFSTISSYLGGSTLTLTRVANIGALTSALNNKTVSYIVIPKNMYLDVIISNNYHIVNTLNNLSLKYVLTLGSNNSLNGIIKKYYNTWINNYLTSTYNDEMFDLYTTTKQVNDKSKTSFMSKRYVYGYVDNLPYEVNMDDQLKGINNEFVSSFSAFTGVEFNFKKYKSVSDLNNALSKGNVDLAFNYYDFKSLADVYQTDDILYSNYVILSNKDNIVIDTIRSLPKTSLYTLPNTKLNAYIIKNGAFDVKTVNKVSDLRNKSLILLDYNTYVYYRNTYFKDFKVAYQSKIDTNYNFIINKSSANELFYSIFNFYLSTISHQQYEVTGMNKIMTKTINLDLSLLWLYAILVPILVILVIAVFRKRKEVVKVRNDVKLKYIDPLTSLKNRYYLNNNIEKWENNNIYPQAIIVINLNNLKDVNDAYGHEGGDHLIKTAANIIINNQVEKTDIVRTDGNEFIIYMIGYDENAVIAYVRKLYRLLKDLPYEYGASLGYSMIEDDIKTIEDAINEAILDMVTNRETKRNSDI